MVHSCIILFVHCTYHVKQFVHCTCHVMQFVHCTYHDMQFVHFTCHVMQFVHCTYHVMQFVHFTCHVIQFVHCTYHIMQFLHCTTHSRHRGAFGFHTPQYKIHIFYVFKLKLCKHCLILKDFALKIHYFWIFTRFELYL